MKVLFAIMPWQSLEYPSLAIGILKSILHETCPEVQTHTLHANIEWAQFLLDETDSELTPNDYTAISDNSFFVALGEWVFSSALNKVTEWNVEPYSAYVSKLGFDIHTALRMHQLAPQFIETLAQRIVSSHYDVVALTSTFMQNVPCLALAARVKELNPNIVTIMGGGNCDGIQGETLHLNFPQLDFVIRGEGEIAFPALIRAISSKSSVDAVPSLSWRSGIASVHNPIPLELIKINDIPIPDFDAYFVDLEATEVSTYVEPRLVLEAARGCWWGEKHHCKFCGLNGSSMKFRSKAPDRLLAELEALVRRHRTLDIIMVDNIIDMKYFKDVLPKLEASEWDLRLHYEVKSNLTEDQMSMLRRGKVAHVQPGIESLNSRVLAIMDKGVSGVQNVRTLRNGEENGMTVSWNFLVGFPGELESDYENILRQITNLFHLQPPASASRIGIERFSPYFDNPAMGFADKSPAHVYELIYNLSAKQLENMVFLFDAPSAGISDTFLRYFNNAIKDWEIAYPHSSLHFYDDGSCLRIIDRRTGRSSDILLTEWKRLAYLILAKPHSADQLYNDLPVKTVSLSDVHSFIVELQKAGLIFNDDSKIVALAHSPGPHYKLVDSLEMKTA